MTVRAHITITCDTSGCKRSFDSGRSLTASARDAAKKHGWRSPAIDGWIQDFCPDHAKDAQ